MKLEKTEKADTFDILETATLNVISDLSKMNNHQTFNDYIEQINKEVSHKTNIDLASDELSKYVLNYTINYIMTSKNKPRPLCLCDYCDKTCIHLSIEGFDDKMFKIETYNFELCPHHIPEYGSRGLSGMYPNINSEEKLIEYFGFEKPSKMIHSHGITVKNLFKSNDIYDLYKSFILQIISTGTDIINYEGPIYMYNSFKQITVFDDNEAKPTTYDNDFYLQDDGMLFITQQELNPPYPEWPMIKLFNESPEILEKLIFDQIM